MQGNKVKWKERSMKGTWKEIKEHETKMNGQWIANQKEHESKMKKNNYIGSVEHETRISAGGLTNWL